MIKTLILATSLVFNTNYDVKNSNEFSQKPKEHIANSEVLRKEGEEWYENNKSRLESKEHICKVWLTKPAKHLGSSSSHLDLQRKCLQEKGLVKQCAFINLYSTHLNDLSTYSVRSDLPTSPPFCRLASDLKYANQVCQIIPGSPKPLEVMENGRFKPGFYSHEYLDCPEKLLYPWSDNQPIKITQKINKPSKKEVESNQYLEEANLILNSGDRKISCNKAMTALNKAIEINNENYLAHYAKGTCFQDIGQEDKAINSLKETLIHKPNYQAASYYLTKSYMRLKQYESVIAVANDALRSSDNEQVPLWAGRTISTYCVDNYGYIYNQKGIALYSLKKYNKAFKAFTCAAGLKVPGAYKKKGWSRLYADTGGDPANNSCDGFCKNSVCQDWESETEANEKKCTFRKQCIPAENAPMGRDCWIWPE